MKFLFDQSADFRLIPHLRQLGHKVEAISRNYPPGLADEDVLAIAGRERRILVVADRDFGELIFHQGLIHAGVILFRLPGAQLQAKIEHLNTVLEEYAEALERGEFLVVTPGQIRVAGRPGQRGASHTQILGANPMPKELKNKREDKKKATLTPKEKKAAKRSKKEAKRV
jgi:predicted nuclease of predicted toxin-antitoxin system